MKLFVKVIPRAKRNFLQILGDRQYKIYVTAAPEHGQANRAVIELLAQHLDIAPSLLTLRAGHSGCYKIVEVDGKNQS